jgi:aminopeptidase N
MTAARSAAPGTPPAPGWPRHRRPSVSRPRTSALRQLAVVVACVLLAACTGAPTERAAEVAPTPRATAAAPWPDPPATRPVVDLRFTVPEDLSSVDGTERIAFTPDLRICELVFRLWPNKPFAAIYGNALEVTDVTVDGRAVEPTVVPAGALDGEAGTLLEVPLPSCRGAGTEVTAELDFRLTLGEGTDERVGVAVAGDVAWFATAFPLLAWERGRGWAREPAEWVTGEMATSESFRLRSLEVRAPSGHEVLATGAPAPVDREPTEGRTIHRFSAPAVRDVAVTVGRMDVLHRELDGYRLHVGVPHGGAHGSARGWATQVERAISRVSDRLGPLPYDDVWVSVLHDQTSGIEFPGAIQFGDVSPAEHGPLITHEVAHQWFYGLVGNNQARDPWLDEAFATFVQLLVDGTEARSGYVGGEVGRPMAHWADEPRPDRAYGRHVYRMGGAALLDARRQAGAEAFDAAVGVYLRDNAHRIVVPGDVEAAFAELPKALRVLRRAGALPADGS